MLLLGRWRDWAGRRPGLPAIDALREIDGRAARVAPFAVGATAFPCGINNSRPVGVGGDARLVVERSEVRDVCWGGPCGAAVNRAIHDNGSDKARAIRGRPTDQAGEVDVAGRVEGKPRDRKS